MEKQAKVVDKSRWYFTQDTEDAIVRYNKRMSNCCNAEVKVRKIKIEGKRDTELDYCSKCENDLEEIEWEYDLSKQERDDIFRTEIYKPFSKLAQSLIHTYDFYYFPVPPEDVEKEVVSVLCSKLYRYNQDEGTAFSFFGVVAKHYLINHNNKNYKYYVTHSSIDNFTDKQRDFKMAEVFNKMSKTTAPEIISDKQEIIYRLIDFLEDEVENLFKKKRDRNIAWSIVELLKHHEKAIENYHKKALYILIREYSGERTQYITQVLNKIFKHYKKITQEYYDNKLNIKDLM